MDKKALLIIILIFILIHKSSGKNAEDKGETAFPLLKINPSVNSSGFAGSNAATMEGIQAVYLNPAGLASIENLDIYAQYTKWFDKMNMGYMAVGKSYDSGMVKAFSVGYIQYPGQKETVADSSSVYNYREVDDFSAETGFVGTSIAGDFSNKVQGGIGVKFIGQRIGDFESAGTFTFDTGIIVRSSPHALYGISLNNLSWGVKYGKDWEPLPGMLKIGGEWKRVADNSRYIGYGKKLDKWQHMLKLCGELRFRDGLYIKGGLEIKPCNFLSFRAGYTYAVESDQLGGAGGASFGIGLLEIKGVDIEYALSSFGRLGIAHRMGLKLSI